MYEDAHGITDNQNPVPGGSMAGPGNDQRTLTARLLVAESVRPGRRAEHRLRLLNLVQQFGCPLGPTELFGLQALLRNRSPAVRQKAEEIIMAASPCGEPDNPETAALMSAFNPFLHVPSSPPRRKSRNSQFKEFCRGAIAAARRSARKRKAEQKR